MSAAQEVVEPEAHDQGNGGHCREHIVVKFRLRGTERRVPGDGPNADEQAYAASVDRFRVKDDIRVMLVNT